MTYDLKKSVLKLKTKSRPQRFALYTGQDEDQILITPKLAKNGDLAQIADLVGEEPVRRCRGICLFENDFLTFKSKTKWNSTLEQSIIKVLRREGLAKFTPPSFLIAGEGEIDDDAGGSPAKHGAKPLTDPRSRKERIERLSGGNPRISKLAADLLAEIEALRAAGREAEAAHKEAYLTKVELALVRTPEASPIPKAESTSVELASASATRMPHPRGQGGAVDFPPEEDFYEAFGDFGAKFRRWVKLVEKGQPKLFDLQAEFDSARAQYADRRAKGQKTLEDGMKREFPRLRALNLKQPRLNTMLQDSFSLPKAESSSNSKVEAAREKIKAALKGVAAAALDVHILELKDVIDDLESQRKKLQATIDRNVGMAEKFIQAALKGPLGIKGMLVSEAKSAALSLASTMLAGIFSEREQAELEKVNRKLSEEKRKLKAAERGRLAALLDKARAELEAETHTLYSAVDEQVASRQKSDSNFTELGTLAANGGVGTFKELKQYRQDMQRLWQAYVDAASAYGYYLTSDPLAAAYRIANERVKLLKQAKDEYLKSGNDKTDDRYLTMMDISDHHRRYTGWYFTEVQKYKEVGKQLARSEHTEIIDRVLAEANKAVNG